VAIDPRPDPEELSHAPTSQVPRIHDSCHNCSKQSQIKKVKKTHKEKESVKSKAAKHKKINEDEGTHSSTDCTACLYCEIRYYESSVPWIQCKVCGKWACGQCAHLGKKNKKTDFKCDGCK